MQTMETWTISVRPARITDAEDIRRLCAQLGYDVGIGDITRRLSRMLARPEHLFVVAECDGQASGWLHAVICEYVEADPFAVVAGLVVDSDHRRRGVGRTLLECAECWATEHSCTVVRLWSSTFRKDAHRFYEQVGYTNLKTQHAFGKALDPARTWELNKFVPRH